jgi:hypothetical protein
LSLLEIEQSKRSRNSASNIGLLEVKRFLKLLTKQSPMSLLVV